MCDGVECDDNVRLTIRNRGQATMIVNVHNVRIFAGVSCCVCQVSV